MESFKKMPFCKFDAKTNSVHTDSIFSKAQAQFAFLEEGLALMNVKMLAKKDLCIHQIVNEDAPSDYYILSYNVFYHPSNLDSMTLKSLSFSNKKWILSKPKALSFATHHKASESENILVFFNKKWFDDYIAKDTAFVGSKVKSFFEGDEALVVWPDNSIELSKLAEDIKDILKNESLQSPLQLKLKTYALVSAFIIGYNPENMFKNYKKLNRRDVIRINKIEFYLIDNIQAKFIGIDALSKKFSISPAKLKSDFNTVYGLGVFSYFRKKQMHLAKEILEQGTYQVKEVALLFEYVNVSKFSKAFEDVNGILPSKIIYNKAYQEKEVI
jgi:AraC-like DNA-binding protein